MPIAADAFRDLVSVLPVFTVIELPASWMLGIWLAEQGIFSAANLASPTGRRGGRTSRTSAGLPSLRSRFDRWRAGSGGTRRSLLV